MAPSSGTSSSALPALCRRHDRRSDRVRLRRHYRTGAAAASAGPAAWCSSPGAPRRTASGRRRLRREVGAFESRVTVEFLSGSADARGLQRLGDLGSREPSSSPPAISRTARGGTSLRARAARGDGRRLERRRSMASSTPLSALESSAVACPASRESGSEAGREAARAARRRPSVLRSPFPLSCPRHSHVDWRQVCRWKIDERGRSRPARSSISANRRSSRPIAPRCCWPPARWRSRRR